MKNLNVCYTVNQAYLNPMLVSIYSLLENNSDLNISIYILYEGLSLENQNIIDQVVSNFSNCHLQMYDATQNYSEFEKYNIPKWRGTQIANARLFLSQLVPNCPDSILYLDSDTIVVGNLNALASQTQENPVAAILDHMPKQYWNELCPTLTKYFNSGILKIDYNLWEINHGYDRIKDTIHKKYPLAYPDQDILNIAFQNKISTLPLSYNLFPVDLYYDIYTLQKFYKNDQIRFYTKEDMLKARENPKILHAADFCGVRTWQKNNIHPFQAIYLEYLIKIFGNSFSLEECDIPSAYMNPKLIKFIVYLKAYTPKEIKDCLKKVLKK